MSEAARALELIASFPIDEQNQLKRDSDLIYGFNDWKLTVGDVRRARAARCQLPAETRNEWQPIETAPHETRVLLGWKYDGAWFCETGMASHGWRRNGISTMSWHGQATHWQPLPDTPALTEKRPPSNQEVGK